MLWIVSDAGLVPSVVLPMLSWFPVLRLVSSAGLVLNVELVPRAGLVLNAVDCFRCWAGS